jgi:drug/metabolite transporter (DMT)-like permease
MRQLLALTDGWSLPTRYRALSPVARGSLLMLVGTLMFAAMHAAIRHTTQQLPAVEAAFFRNVFGLLVIAPLLLRHGPGLFYTKRLGLHVLRAVLNVFSMLTFFVGLSLTPIARATALSFTAPLFTALLGALMLGEAFRWRRWTAIACGFVGALVILRPGVQAVDSGAWFVVASSLLWSVAMIDIKVLGRTESSLTITAYVTVLLIPMTLLPAALVWQTPSPALWGWLLFIGVVGTLGQMAVTEALKHAEITALMPFDFLKLAWATLIGLVAFGERPDLLTVLGAAIVFASSFYIAWREATLRRTDRARVDCPRARGARGARARTGSPLAPGEADANPP